MRTTALSACLLSSLLACHSSGSSSSGASRPPEPSTAVAKAPDEPAPAPTPGSGSGSVAAAGSGSATAPAPAPVDTHEQVAPPAPAGHDFLPEIDALRDIVLCGKSDPWPHGAKVQAKHCKRIADAQQLFRDKWMTPATAFFATVVPAGLPKTVVYPFAGGDLATALTVFPDATEITTLSLEPAGDPRDLAALSDAEMAAAVDVIAYELHFNYLVNFSNTKNMINAMRGGRLPTQLVFSLSALQLNDCQVTAAYYFTVNPDGTLHYIDEDDLAKMPPVDRGSVVKRNDRFADVELHFRRPGDTTDRIYRHIEQNLDNPHLKADDRVLKHLVAKGQVTAMTKAASYLLHWGEFSTIRDYLIDHMAWMVSDASGIPLKYVKDRGFTQEVWGTFAGAHMSAGKGSNAELFKLFKSQPVRKMPVHFGYYDKANRPHLIVTRHV